MLDADDRRATPLLFLTHRSAQRGLDAVDTSFPACGKHVGNTLAVAGPARDRTRDSVLQVVRMSNDGNRVLPIVGKRLQAHVGMLREHTNRSRCLEQRKSVMTWGARSAVVTAFAAAWQ